MAVAARLSIFDDFDGLFLAPGAFKGALIVVWRIGGLDTDEPHLSATRFATREAHRPRLPNYLIRSHATRPRLLSFVFSTAHGIAHLKNTYTNKKSWWRRIFWNHFRISTLFQQPLDSRPPYPLTGGIPGAVVPPAALLLFAREVKIRTHPPPLALKTVRSEYWDRRRWWQRRPQQPISLVGVPH